MNQYMADDNIKISKESIFSIGHIRHMMLRDTKKRQFKGNKASVWNDVKDLDINEGIKHEASGIDITKYRMALHQLSVVGTAKYRTKVVDGIFHLKRVK